MFRTISSSLKTGGQKAMAKQRYALNQGEKIVFKEGCIRHGFWGLYTHTLVVTNQAVILEQYGILNNFKGIIRYPYSGIKQAIIGKAFNGENQLELYINGKIEDFAPQSGDDNVLKTLVMAINDQLSSDAESYDYNYYQTILDGSAAAEKEIEHSMSASNNAGPFNAQSGLSFVGDVAKKVSRSGDLSLRGVQKGINKAIKKQAKKGLLGGFMDELLDEIGVHDIQDCFTEIGNDFREGFGLPHKMTHEERCDFQEQEQKRQKQELKRKKREVYNRQVEMAKQQVNAEKAASKPKASENQGAKMSINEQLDVLKKLKELMDAGILTQEEFDRKKQEIMNL